MDAVLKGRMHARRYPALVLIAVAAALASMLPTRLVLPTANPSSLAEFAPVPGESDAGGQLSGLGLGSYDGSPGRGSTTGYGHARPPDAGPPQPSVGLKRCVGRPLRQTEDPLSPSCVAFFRGDNGGATGRGVTRDEITVVVFRDTSGAPRFVDWFDPITEADQASNASKERVGKALARFFNERYQTYGRRVHLFAYYGGGAGVEELRASVGTIDTALKPFAIVPIITLGVPVIAGEAARRGIVTASFTAFERGVYRAVAPKLISFRPDLSDEADLVVSFVCAKLAGRPVRRGDASDAGKTRKFGILWSDRPDEPGFAQLKDLVRAGARSQCGENIAEAATRGSGTDAARENALALASLRSEGVTSVLPMSNDAILFTNSQGWYPEWIVPGTPGIQQIDTNATARLLGQSQWRNALGISYDYRRGPLPSQAWYMAFREGCPDCAEPTTSNENPALYEATAMLMYGIQAAGPSLTFSSLDRGLHAIPQRPSGDRVVPTAFFRAGNFSYVKDAMPIVWDPSGDDPVSSAKGCYRLPSEGKRFLPGEWPPGDDDLFAGGPCQGSYGR